MCKIIQFQTKGYSNGYKNLSALFEVCNDVAVYNEYLDMAEAMWKNQQISESEILTLRRIGRIKRIVAPLFVLLEYSRKLTTIENIELPKHSFFS